MKIDLDILMRVAVNYEKLSLGQEHSQSSQAGDIYAAIFKSKVLGLKGPDASNAEFDVNSPAADKIFGIMDNMNFRGEIVISVLVNPNKTVALKVITTPNSPKVAAAIQQTFQSSVAATIKQISPPASVVEVPNVVTAKNA